MERIPPPSSDDMNPEVNPYAAPLARAADETVGSPPIFKTWLIYSVVMIVASWAISAMLGITAFRWLMAGGSGQYWLIPVISLVFTLPVSYLVFRWVLQRYLLRAHS